MTGTHTMMPRLKVQRENKVTPMSTARRPSANTQGFSLVEMLVAITVTMIIMGSVYGLMAQGQSAFGREPFLADRQQQMRIAMDRIQEDVLSAGLGLGGFFQVFGTGLNNVGPQGVRAAADTTLGGANSDHLEIRSSAADCPPVRTVPGNERNGANLNFTESVPSCYPEPGMVLLLFPDGRSKYGWGHNQHSNNEKVNFPNGQQPTGSQITTPGSLACSVWIDGTSPNGNACPASGTLTPVPPAPCPACPPYAILQASIIRYQIGTDTDGTVGLFRSATGGMDTTTELTTNPPGAAWQLVASGIEDLQVEYRTTNSGATWLNAPPLLAESTPGNIVLEVRLTLWGRALTPANTRLVGETRSRGADATGVTAVRGSLVSIVAPRAAQEALATLGLWK